MVRGERSHRKTLRNDAKTTTMSNTTTILGNTLDKEMIALADACVRGAGDGRISTADAQKLLARIKDSNNYTDLEKETMVHIRKHYIWTEEADEWFRTQVRSWAAGTA